MSSYRGPVEIFTEDGEHIASAQGEYTIWAQARSGLNDWRGLLRGIRPPHALPSGGPYRLRLPGGEEGTILVDNVRVSLNSPEKATFVGAGNIPGEDSA